MPRSVVGVAVDEFVERGLHGELFVAERGGELVDGGGLVRGVNDGFQSGFSFFVGHLVCAIHCESIKSWRTLVLLARDY